MRGWVRGGVRLCVAATAVVALLCASTPATASGETYPPYNGAMSFPSIDGPADPEDFSWEVQLSEEEELRAIDDQHVAVYYTDGEHLAMLIVAEQAHDAEGATVPTTLAVSEGNVITLTVHHRAGNQAAGGAPFHYPILAGPGWEGGFQTYPGIVSESVNAASVRPPCRVPDLRGRSLKATRRLLLQARCRLGPVRGDRSRGAKVVRQYRHPGKALPAGTEVGVKLGS
jgi:hypothetical protein